MSLKSSNVSKHRSSLLTWLEFRLFTLVEFSLSRMPVSWAYRFVESLLRLLFQIVPRYRQRTIANLDVAYGNNLTVLEKKQLFRRYLRYLAWFFADVVMSPRLLKKSDYLARVDCREAIALFQKLGAREKTGVVVIASHQGAPDVMALALGANGWPLTAVARPLDNPRLDQHLNEQRHSFDSGRLPKHGALFPAQRLLRQKAMVGFQIDQDAGPTGIFVPYFGKLASTHAGAATLAILNKVPVVVLHCIRTRPRSFEFKIFAETVELPSEDLPRNELILDLTVRMTNALEVMARGYPEQVMWGHRRWKTRPVYDPARESKEKRQSGELISAGR
ncbi:MAG: hypothetical protein KJT03_15975 [Verrucomicrobiae bacterium]|nr:hypothetical protein [Verrucomicrobiae bacterium]